MRKSGGNGENRRKTGRIRSDFVSVKFTVLGEPKGKGRPRFIQQTGRAITPKDTANYETLVRMEYMAQCQGYKFPDGTMLDMRILAFYSIPKSATKKNKELMKKQLLRPTKKPEIGRAHV